MTAQSRIQIACGKGGVGKTTLALALGMRHAAAGRKVVVVTSHPLPELAVSVSLEGLAQRSPTAARNLFVVHLDPRALLAEVVEANFPVPILARAVLQSDIYKNLVEVAPGLKEFYFLARLQLLAERKSKQNLPDYEILLWDAPATGHFLSTLRAARDFEAYLTGPLAGAGADMKRFFSNAENVAVLPITTLEEMAMEETLDLCRSMRSEFNLRASSVLLNLVSPLAGASPERAEEARRAAESSSDPALHFAVERGVTERERAESIRKSLDAPVIPVPRTRRGSSDVELLERIGSFLEGVWG
ncbi:MAG: ArsA-related P-loop ATPase [Bryobacteraceae bacterium]